MKRLLHLSVFLTSIILFATACEEEMPEPNEWRILEWTVDGERHKASCESGGLFGCSATDVSYNLSNGSFNVSGATKTEQEDVYIYIYIFRGLKLNQSISFGEHDYMYYSKTNYFGCEWHKAIDEMNRLLYISEIDTTNKIIEGYFEFEGINDCQDTIQIKDGYFKVSF
jgi:hypothetical protein